MKQKILNYIRAVYTGLYIRSHEEVRVEAVVKDVVTELATLHKGKRDDENKMIMPRLYSWSVTKGLICVFHPQEAQIGTSTNAESPMDAMDAFLKAEPWSVYLMKDFHMFLEDKNPLVIRKVKDCLDAAKSTNKCMIITGCRLVLPPELEKELTVLEFALPDREQLQIVEKNVLEGAGMKLEDIPDQVGVMQAAAGLTTIEAENAFSLSLVEAKTITRDQVYREKCNAIAKQGLLEVVETTLTINDIGGCHNLKKWITHRKDAFSDEAKAYGVPQPRGVFFVGNPGTGKSLMSKIIKSVLGIPLLRLDAGRLFGSLVGQSEQNLRTVHALAKAMAPVIVWVDEVDGMMSGAESSGKSDGGTTARVIKTFLTLMQEDSEGIFYVMTANDIDNIPSPLLRRMDEVWNVELPNETERRQIWEVQIRKYKRVPANYDIDLLAARSPEYSGAEIEKIVVQGLHLAYPEKREVETKDFLAVIEEFSPMSKTMAADIERRRKRLEGVAKLAGGEAPAAAKKPVKTLRNLNKAFTG